MQQESGGERKNRETEYIERQTENIVSLKGIKKT